MSDFGVVWAMLDVANFYEKALFVKTDVAASLCAERNYSALRAMLLSALLAGQLSLVTRCIG
jgi:hypothetical protein